MRWLYGYLVICLMLVPTSIVAGEEHGDGDDEREGSQSGVEISEENLERLGLRMNEAGQGNIVQGIAATGRIVPVDGRLANVSPRFTGVVTQVSANVGDHVKPGSPLAVVQSNQNLQPFTLTPAIAGIVIKRSATLGEVVTETSVLFVVADLSELWAELAVYGQDVAKVHIGQKVILSVASCASIPEGTLVFLSPVTDEKTQSRIARVHFRSPDSCLSPGIFVDAKIITEATQVPLVVQADALQQINGRPTVFLQEGEYLRPQAIVVGRADAQTVEVLQGLTVGTRYVTGNTFILKAELGKGEVADED
ncbi:MAG: efflux RND transporter periplasmic adaptor subunit [Pirellulales bacterium]|nr:efflux RND transporter periplasmic adaptor subunit [Pirellulales bacterium]